MRGLHPMRGSRPMRSGTQHRNSCVVEHEDGSHDAPQGCCADRRQRLESAMLTLYPCFARRVKLIRKNSRCRRRAPTVHGVVLRFWFRRDWPQAPL
jgi:hypothetical protein